MAGLPGEIANRINRPLTAMRLAKFLISLNGEIIVKLEPVRRLVRKLNKTAKPSFTG
jgi:hypothetical protein